MSPVQFEHCQTCVNRFRMTPIRTLVAGLGNMGRSHALAYHANPAFEIVGLVNRSDPATCPTRSPATRSPPTSHEALARLKPDLVSIATYSDSHADYAVAAMEAGAHVFVEKPLATTVADAERVAAAGRETGRKVVVGYILRHHPSWQRLIAEARALGGPYVFRLNLNQQSSGPTWETHKALMQTTSPIVDCGVHYVDVMCQITDARPVEVRGMGLRLSDEIAPDMYNYGHFQVLFADGSLGWYEAGWGPMMSDTAFFVKDVVSPNGAVSIRMPESARSDDIDTHTRTSTHPPATAIGAAATRTSSMADEPGHQALCDRAGRLRRRGDRATTSTSPATSRTPSPRSPSASPRTRACAPAAPSSSEEQRHGPAQPRSRHQVLRHRSTSSRASTSRSQDGEFCVFVGPSGCGKSTLLRIIAGLEDATAGDILIDGRRVNATAPADREIAMVFQTYALYPHLTVQRQHGPRPQAGRHARADDRRARRQRLAACSRSTRSSPAARPSSPAASASASPSAAPSCAPRSSSSSTSRSRTSTPRCASTPASRSPACTASSRRR